MAVTTKFIDLAHLERYDGLIKAYIDSPATKAYKAFAWDSTTNTLYAWRKHNPEIGVDTADFSKTFAAVASSGTAADVAIVDKGSLITATNVEDALQELATASAGGVASKTVYITETAGGSSDPYSKKYGIYQGSTGSSASPVASEKLADIDIPKDMVVEDGSVVDVVFVAADNSLHEGSASGTDVTAEIKGTGTATADDAGKYIKLTIANAASSHLWIKATDLVDIYTAEQDAAQVQLVIDSNNVISATIVAGSIGTTELADDAVTTAKILDDAVTADKVAIAAHTESQTAGADGVAISVTTTDGQVSAVSASIAANTYDAYGTAAGLIADLDATKSQIAGADGLALSITETDGVITSISGSIAANTYDAYGAATAAVEALDATPSQPAGADGLALSLTEVDGVVTAISGSIAANTYDAYGTAAAAIADLDATESQTAGTDGLALSVTQTDGVITAISGSIASGTYYDTATYGIADNNDIDGLFS